MGPAGSGRATDRWLPVAAVVFGWFTPYALGAFVHGGRADVVAALIVATVALVYILVRSPRP